MFHLSSLMDLLLLWFCLAASVAMVVVTVRARRVEREQGLPRSRYRIPTAVGICTILAVLVYLGTVSIIRPPAPAAEDSGRARPTGPGVVQPPVPVQKPQNPAEAQELARLKGARAELDRKIAEIERQIQQQGPATLPSSSPTGAAGPPAEPGSATPAEGFDFRAVARLLVPLFLIAGGFLLLYLGDPRLLFRAGRFALGRDQGALRGKALAGLDTLAALSDQGRFRDGLAQADALDVNLLESFDRMDWSFLKSYCAVQLATATGVPADEGRGLLGTAVRTLVALLEDAPNRGEAVYLLATAHGLLGQPQEALDTFDRARALLPKKQDLPFAHNESVCLLDLAEKRLSEGDAEGSGRLFDRVTRLKVLGDQIPTSLVKIRLLNVRRSLQAGQLAEAEGGLQVLRQLEGLNDAQRQNVEVICDALQTLISVRGGDDEVVVGQVSGFLDKHLPTGLPEPDEGIADEYLDTPLAGSELRLAPEIYRAFLFLKAEVAARTATRHGGPLSPVRVAGVAAPLFRALQFELRQRDVLAALGGLYYWFIPEKRHKAIGWLEAAIDMGAESLIARRILERSRQVEVENREALEWFRSTAVPFLHDPTVRTQVRQALVEELGRFQGFQTLLLDLDPKIDLEPQEPTLTLLRQRAGYMERMVADLAARKAEAVTPQLHQLRRNYAQLIVTIDTCTDQMADIERQLMQEIGKTVLT